MSTADAIVSTQFTYFCDTLQTQVIRDFDGLKSISSSWSRLWRQSSSATIFQSLPWISAWWKAFGKHLDLCTLVVQHGTDVVGVLPLVRSGVSVRFLGSPGADYCDILCDEGQGARILEAALRALFRMSGWRTCTFSNLRDDSVFIRSLSDLPRDVMRCMRTHESICRSSLRLDGNRNAIIDAMRRKPALRRHRNKLNKAGCVRFCHLEDREQIHHYLNTLFQQHIGRRAIANEPSQFLSPEWRGFYHAMVDEMNPKDDLRFSILELDDRPIACHFGFECKSSLTLYKPTFDVDMWALSPGDVLLSEMLAYARDRQLNEVDFTVGSEAYKEHFTNYTRDMYCTVLYRQDWRTGIRRTLQPLHIGVTNWLRMTGWRQDVARSLRKVHQQCRELSIAASIRHSETNRVLYKYTSETPLTDTGIGRSVRPATFTDLTELAMQYPHSIDTRALQLYLSRLHRGHECFLHRDGNATSMAWVRSTSVIVAFDSGETAARPVTLLYEAHILGDASSGALSVDFLHWLAWHAESARSVACVCLPRLTYAMRRIIIQEGFAQWADAQLVQEQPAFGN